ncbi:MAG TPA: hypothetical protein VK830_06035, partial [Xanthomonadales bacterium]|nr:hypothetical protein [Xanthomonadales bacterium]
VAGFLVLSHLPRALLDPPQFDFLLVAWRYDHQQPRQYTLDFEVRDGELRGLARPVNDSVPIYNRQFASLFRYHAAQNRFSEIDFELPDGLEELERTRSFSVPEAGHLELDGASESADGYRFEHIGYRGRGGLLGELFGMGQRYENQYVLRKNGADFELPRLPIQAWYDPQNLRFLGWVLGEDRAP